MQTPLRRHRAFYIAAVCGVAGSALAFLIVPSLAITIGADIFFSVYLVLALVGFTKLTPAFLKKKAKSADEPVWLIFLATFAAVVVAVISLFLLINQAQSPDPIALTLALLALPLGWFMIHMMATLHYAHLYWQPETTEAETVVGPGEARRGLDFPGQTDPCGQDFLYFAFTIGMTAQTSDVEIDNTTMRLVCLVHSIVSFFFNTVLVAAAVNVAVSLGH